MIRISDEIKKMIEESDFLQFGLSHRLLNLSQVAAYLVPLIETRTKKEVSKSAVLMSLSRLQKNYSKIMPKMEDIRLKAINIFSNLSVASFEKTDSLKKKLFQFYETQISQNRFMVINESTHEVTVMLDAELLDDLQKHLGSEMKYLNPQVAGVSVAFDEEYFERPGVIYSIFQQLTLQGISVVEVSSTYTELIIYVNHKDVKLVFDSLFNRFSVGS